MYKTTTTSPLGTLTLVSDGKNLMGLFIEDQKYFLKGFTNLILKDDLEIFNKTKSWLEKSVWKCLLNIPYGSVTTYKELAKLSSKKLKRKNMSFQAIGQAVGHNPIAIIIPCHRVIGTNGSLTGYAGGLEKKLFLLRLEQNFNYDK